MKQIIGIAILGLICFGLAIAHFFFRDAVWDWRKGQMRASGIANPERTPEWERDATLTGWVFLVFGIVGWCYVFLQL